MPFIHDEANFSQEKIRERARLHGFSDPIPVEFFLWDCEIAAQLQNESEAFILKGGTAVQLHLPIESQRASIDIDVVCPFKEGDIAEVLSHIHERNPTFEFEKYMPKRPKKDIKMITYLAKMPALIPSESGTRAVKIDFLLEDLKLPVEAVANVETFALKVKKLDCYSVSSLVGDKLLTLAENTVGIIEPADIPKQIYDVSVLTEETKLTEKQLSEIIAVIDLLTPLEAGYRGLKLTAIDALNDVEKTIEKYCLLDTPVADSSIKNNIVIFQQTYVRSSQKKPWFEWSIRALRIKLLCQYIRAVVGKQLALEEASKSYDLAAQMARVLENMTGEEVKLIRSKLMGFIRTDLPYRKHLKGKPIHRLFWQAVNLENLAALLDSIKI
ncbi:MAG: nucleotidyl transferase AbiEii/AbiGii toxin family protein [Candidatus Bathyarchaeia archaeon]|jgi:predicted nucleotidyltransferase component of viral defense system